ncbi:MAG: bifunctional proline dehydrogenase/L-glutamate gamma-semialdehyde dehydrogenase [Aeromicrobium sp.]
MTDLTLADRSVELVRAWIDPQQARKHRPSPAARRLAKLLKDPDGLEFTIAFVDRVVRPEDTGVAARNLRDLASSTPAFLPWIQRFLLKLGALVSLIAPTFVVTTARGTLRRMVGHLVIDARPRPLGKAIGKLRRSGDRLNLNLLGEAVLGDGEAERRRDATLRLLERADVDYVSVKVSSVASQLSMWAFDESVARVVEQLEPLYAKAAEDDTFINLDMEEYHDLDLTIAVFIAIMDRFPQLRAGIVLQAYLPDALGAMQHLQSWATVRRAAGGAPVKVRVVKGANLAMERVDATIHGWPLATWGSKVETDAGYKRVLDWALTPDRTDAVEIGVAGQNLFDIAYAWLLAGDRGVRDAVTFEVLLGMDSGPVDTVRDEVGGLLLYTPVVDPGEFDVAIAYLVRRLEENASDENFMSAAFDIGTDPQLMAREVGRFLESVDLMEKRGPEAHRVQDRTAPVAELSPDAEQAFRNTPDTDPSIEVNRVWASRALSRVDYTQIGNETVRQGLVAGPASLETVIHDTRDAAMAWNARGSDVRAWILHQAGRALESRRGDLITVMAAEAGKTVAEGDVEVSEAIDFAHYYAESGRRLDAVDGAVMTPAKLTVVIPPWNFPVAIPAGMVLAGLAAGSGVIIKAAPQTRRCAAVMVEALWQAGVPRDLLRVATLEEGPLSKAMVAHSDVDRVLLTGGWETAALFRSWKPDLALSAETSGKNALVVTPSADLDLAVSDLVKSAFGHAGQKCSAASLGILVGSVGTSERFRRQLVDAVRSLKVGHPVDPEVAMGPIIEPPRGKLLSGLTKLGPGESWLLEPQRIGDDDRLWTPGIRDGVRPGSEFHRTEYFGPVLGLMHADSLGQALEWQNATDYGLTAGIHSLDPDEVNQWIDTVQAGNLYVNRGITGAIVQRQPFGGWKRSSVGTTCKAGGPNFLLHLGTWHSRPLRRTADRSVLRPSVTALLDAAAPHLGAGVQAELAAAATSDEIAWRREFGVSKDVSGLGVERNVFRYRVTPVSIRADHADLADVVRVLLAAARTGAPIDVSTTDELPAGLVPPEVSHTVESRAAWLTRVAAERPARIRLIGGGARDAAVTVEGDPDVAIYGGAVTLAGRLELLPFLREQAVTITQHRFGNHDPSFDRVLPRSPR